jgi:hypothetical protein
MNRNWRNKYHKESEFDQANKDPSEHSDSDPEEYQLPLTLPANQVPHSRRFSIWLSTICYILALSIVIALSYDWATTTVDENISPATATTQRSNTTADCEFAEFSQPDIEDTLHQIVEDPEREPLFRERLNSLYLVILGAVAGYLHAIRNIDLH